MNKDWKEITKKNYNLHAKSFAEYAKIYRGGFEKKIEQFSKQFKKGSRILDIGCGSGRDAKYFSDKGFEVVGIDLSEELIKICQETSKGTFMLMDFEKIEFPDHSFDGVWAIASLVHVPKKNLSKALRKIKKIIKKNGHIFATFRFGDKEVILKDLRGDVELERFYSYFQTHELKEIFTKEGFKNIETEVNQDWVHLQAMV
jgi:ubiquinone/menaquinone biosynthesis C-methylase UbiE